MSVHRGMRGYATMLAALREPMTSDALGEKVGVWSGSVRAFCRRAYGYRLIHITGWTRSYAGGPYACVWKQGDGPDAPYPNGDTAWKWADRSDDKPAVRSEMLAFSHFMAALAEPCTKQTLRDLTGIREAATRTLIEHLRTLGMVRIAGWERADNGLQMPMFALGAGRNAERLPRITHAEQCRVNQRKAREREMTLRLVHLTAAPIRQPLPLAA